MAEARDVGISPLALRGSCRCTAARGAPVEKAGWGRFEHDELPLVRARTIWTTGAAAGRSCLL